MSDSYGPVALGADFAGFSLKQQVRNHLLEAGWEVLDLTPDRETAPMYQRAGFLIGSAISEGTAYKALAFCGTGMGIHVAASKCPHVHAGVAESVRAARRAATANNCNVLAMGGFWTAPRLGIAMADAFLSGRLGEGYEEWDGFFEYHKRGYEECENFDYEAYKANGWALDDESVPELGEEPKGLAY